MANELLDIKDFVSILEAILIILVSFVGASVHEYVFGGVRKGFLKNPNVISTVVVVFIICYSINPLIVSFNPRFILLPPLILGLLGNELTKRMGTIKGTSSLLEYVLGFFSIKNKVEKHDGLDELETKTAKDKNEDKPPKEEKKKVESPPSIEIDDRDEITIIEEEFSRLSKELEKLKANREANTASSQPIKKDTIIKDTEEEITNIDSRLEIILNNIEKAIKVSNTKKEDTGFNIDSFKDHYEIIKIDIALLRSNIKNTDKITMTSALKLAEVLKKEEELDELFNSTNKD